MAANQTRQNQLWRQARKTASSARWQLWLCLATALGGCAPAARQRVENPLLTQAYQRQSDGLIVTPRSGPARRVRLQLISERIVRVTAVPVDSLVLPASLAVTVPSSSAIEFKLDAQDDQITLKTARLSARVSLENGAVSFLDANGMVQLSERDRGAFTPVQIEGQTFYRVHQVFNPARRRRSMASASIRTRS
jgi:alpha-D-xyloside xylohydrolase